MYRYLGVRAANRAEESEEENEAIREAKEDAGSVEEKGSSAMATLPYDNGTVFEKTQNERG